MEPIRVVIADDDEGMRLIECRLLAKMNGFDLVGEAADGEDLLREVEEKHPQIVFLDVEMPKKTGVECARIIQDMDPGIVLIFATAHDQYMGDAFEVYAFDYLVKPFRMERMEQTLLRARDRILGVRPEPVPVPSVPKGSGGRIMIRHRNGLAFLDMDEILLVQREDRATVIYAEGDRRFVTGETLAETEAKLDPAVFFRCHKSYIINLNKIRSIEPYGRWTYIVKLEGTGQDALITHEKYDELEHFFA